MKQQIGRLNYGLVIYSKSILVDSSCNLDVIVRLIQDGTITSVCGWVRLLVGWVGGLDG